MPNQHSAPRYLIFYSAVFFSLATSLIFSSVLYLYVYIVLLPKSNSAESQIIQASFVITYIISKYIHDDICHASSFDIFWSIFFLLIFLGSLQFISEASCRPWDRQLLPPRRHDNCASVVSVVLRYTIGVNSKLTSFFSTRTSRKEKTHMCSSQPEDNPFFFKSATWHPQKKTIQAAKSHPRGSTEASWSLSPLASRVIFDIWGIEVQKQFQQPFQKPSTNTVTVTQKPPFPKKINNEQVQ